MTYKHYIKIDENNLIIDAFSSAFRQPEGGEILVEDTNERHFNLQLKDEQGILQYKWQDPDIVKIDIPTRPNEYYDWDGSVWVPNIEKMKKDMGPWIRKMAREMLNLSGCKIVRHRDEVDDGGSKMMDESQYQSELTHRRTLREFIDGMLDTVENAIQLDDIVDIKMDILNKMKDEKERYKD